MSKGLKPALSMLHCVTLPPNYNSTNENNNIKGSSLNSLFNVILTILAEQDQNVPLDTLLATTAKKQQSIGCSD